MFIEPIYACWSLVSIIDPAKMGSNRRYRLSSVINHARWYLPVVVAHGVGYTTSVSFPSYPLRYRRALNYLNHVVGSGKFDSEKNSPQRPAYLTQFS